MSGSKKISLFSILAISLFAGCVHTGERFRLFQHKDGRFMIVDTSSKNLWQCSQRPQSVTPADGNACHKIDFNSVYGEIYVKTAPARAEVTLDGEVIKTRTPVVVGRILKGEKHTLRVERDGFQTWEQKIELGEEPRKILEINLDQYR